MPPTSFFLQWLVAWTVLGATFYVIAEFAQRFLYDGVVDRLFWRVVLTTPLLAGVLVAWPVPFQDIFYDLSLTLTQALLWFILCWLGLRFQWQHAAAAALAAVFTIGPITSAAVSVIKSDEVKAPPTRIVPRAPLPVQQN